MHTDILCSILILMFLEFSTGHSLSSVAWDGVSGNNSCIMHSLACTPGNQIYVLSAFYGFGPRSKKQTTLCTNRKTCCPYSRGGCFVRYTAAQMADVFRCSGKQTCSTRSRTTTINRTCKGTGKLYRVNSFTQIQYNCYPAPGKSGSRITSRQVVIDGSTTRNKKCTYRILSRWYRFYQTNYMCKKLEVHKNFVASCNRWYMMWGNVTLTVDNNPGIFIIIKAPRKRLTVESHCIDTKAIIEDSTNNPTEWSTTQSPYDHKYETTTKSKFIMYVITRGYQQDSPFDSETERLYSTTTPRMTSNIQPYDSHVILRSSVIGGLGLILLMAVIVVFVLKRLKLPKSKDNSQCVNNPMYGVTFENHTQDEIQSRGNNSVSPPIQSDDYNRLQDINIDDGYDHITGLTDEDFTKSPAVNDTNNHLTSSTDHDGVTNEAFQNDTMSHV